VTDSPHCSTSVLHKQWTRLEDEHRELATAIEAAQAKGVGISPVRKRQESLLLKINSLVAKIRDAPVTTTEDFLALLDVALEHELDLACDIAFYGPADYPMISRLFRALARTAPGFEFNSLRRWLSAGQLRELLGEPTLARSVGADASAFEQIGFGGEEIPPSDCSL
jgi:hypothetical protein